LADTSAYAVPLHLSLHVCMFPPRRRLEGNLLTSRPMQFAAIQGESGGVRGGGGDGDGGSGGSGGSSGGGGTESDASSDNTIWYAQARD
jgi:uncharacterized membrane protein YgcG